MGGFVFRKVFLILILEVLIGFCVLIVWILSFRNVCFVVLGWVSRMGVGSDRSR